MFKKRKPKPLRKDLQEIVDRISRNRDFSSTSQPTKPPPAAKRATPAPAVIFYSYEQFLQGCHLKTLLGIAQDRRRWFGLKQSERDIIRKRLGASHGEIMEYQAGYFFSKLWPFRSSGRTGQPGPEEKQR